MRDDIISRVRSESNSPPEIDLSRYIIPQGVDIPKPDSIFELSGIPVFTKKSISTLIGKAKSGKTTATAWVVAQCLIGGLRVLWIDTEQGEYYGSRTQYWILSIAHMKLCANLTYMDLKSIGPVERSKTIEHAIQEYTPDLVILDGIRDLVFDINSPEESTIIVGSMMRWAEQHDLHVLSILHQNKGNEHARGHLGAEMVNKSETVLKVEMDENRNVVCTPEFTRSDAFPVFAFTRDGYGIPILIDGYTERVEVGTGSRSVKPADYSIDEHREYLRTAFRGSESLNYGELQGAVSAAFGLYGISLGERKTKEFISHFVLIGLLKYDKDGRYTNYYISD